MFYNDVSPCVYFFFIRFFWASICFSLSSSSSCSKICWLRSPIWFMRWYSEGLAMFLLCIFERVDCLMPPAGTYTCSCVSTSFYGDGIYSGLGALGFENSRENRMSWLKEFLCSCSDDSSDYSVVWL